MNILKPPLLFAILLALAIWVLSCLWPENSLQEQMGGLETILEEDLPMIMGNSLLSRSYIPFKPEILGDIVSEPVNYCGVGYLSNFWPMDLVWDASKICEEESRGQWWRVNENWFGTPEISCGLFQVNVLVHLEYTCEEMKNQEKNVLAAIKIYESEGWKAWYNSARKIGILP